MKVDIEKVFHLLNELKQINVKPIEEIEFYSNGKKLEIAPEIIERWKFIGLNNTEFIETRYYRGLK